MHCRHCLSVFPYTRRLQLLSYMVKFIYFLTDLYWANCFWNDYTWWRGWHFGRVISVVFSWELSFDWNLSVCLTRIFLFLSLTCGKLIMQIKYVVLSPSVVFIVHKGLSRHTLAMVSYELLLPPPLLFSLKLDRSHCNFLFLTRSACALGG